MLTVLVQIVLCKMAIACILSVQFINAIALIIMAIKTPRFLQDFMLGGGGGGLSNMVITTSKSIELTGQLKRKLSQLKKVS